MQNLTFCYFRYSHSFCSILVQKFLKYDMALSKYNIFSDAVMITNGQSVRNWFEREAGICTKNWQQQQCKSLILHENAKSYSSNNLYRVSIENSKISEISELTLELYFEMFCMHPCGLSLNLPTTGTFLNRQPNKIIA